MCENQGLLPEPPADYNEDICVMRADGSNIVNLTNTPSTFDNFPSWGPEARHDRKIDRHDARAHAAVATPRQ